MLLEEVCLLCQVCPLGKTLLAIALLHFVFQGKPFYITVIQVYAPTTNAKDTEAERFYEDLQDLLELTPKTTSFSL